MSTKSRPRCFSRLMLLVPVLLLATPLPAADRFLRVGDIAGESDDPQHPGWSEIVDFKFGVSHPNSSGPPNFSDVVILKTVDKSSPLLFLKCCTGEVMPTVQINLTRPVSGSPPEVYYTITLTDAVITSVQSETGGSVPAESISFTFSSFQISYKPPSGPPISAGWDRLNNTPLP